MRVGIIGGKLQGVEASYLALKAGWEVILFDKHPAPPAKGLCHTFHHVDVTREKEFIQHGEGIELIIPALENQETLTSLSRSVNKLDIPLAYDPSSYAVSSSKIKSDRLFSDLGLPLPLPWPRAGFPLVAKPSGASGSAGVRRINTDAEFLAFRSSGIDLQDWVIQEFLEGPSFSLEVLGSSKGYQTFQVTDLEMDNRYDCKRVLAPTVLPESQIKAFEDTALAIARRLDLRGIMDVEVILHNGRLKILEIDARIPSQTPTVVYLSTGINLLEGMRDAFAGNPQRLGRTATDFRGVIYEHIHVSPGRLEVSGEHVMSEAGPLQFLQGFFGADEALSNYQPGRPDWVATVINVDETRDRARAKRDQVIEQIKRACSIHKVLDPSPPGAESHRARKVEWWNNGMME
jgi:pyrrolysine biosynthesis protein PylC